jgi:hypothetical protein
MTSEMSMIKINANARFRFDFWAGLSRPVRYLGMIGFNHVLRLHSRAGLV